MRHEKIRTMLLTTHEVLGVLQGTALTVGLDDDSEGLLRLEGMPVDPESLAEPHARRNGLPIVELTRERLLEVAHGERVLGAAAGEPIGVRIMTVDELLEAHRKACLKYGGEPSLTRRQAAELVAHL